MDEWMESKFKVLNTLFSFPNCEMKFFVLFWGLKIASCVKYT